ncbi:TIGR00266 family protein [Candidatus Marsarchaeota archaeon]|nr:TIGR00266 family protein [Candidatus Marsarchaeota archaeon]
MKYEIIGHNMQLLKVTLAPGERIFGDSGTLVSKNGSIIMTPRIVGGIGGLFARKITGATGMLTEFKSTGSEGHVSLAGVYPGKVLEIDLDDNQVFIAEQKAYLASEDTIKFTFQMMSLGAMWFGKSGITMQRFVGPGKVFLHITGDIIEHEVTNANPIEIDPGHVAGFDGGLQYKITFVDNIKTAMFGGVGLFLVTFSGNGRVVTHSISRTKFAAQIYIDGKSQQKNK